MPLWTYCSLFLFLHLAVVGARKNKYKSTVLNRARTPGVLIEGLSGSAWACIRWPWVKWCKRRLMWGSVGDPLLLPSATERSYQKSGNHTDTADSKVNSLFVLARPLSHSELAKGWPRLSRLTWSMYQIWFGVVNSDPGSLESQESSKLILIGTLFLPQTLTQAPLWATGCLKLVTAVVFQPLLGGQHTDST